MKSMSSKDHPSDGSEPAGPPPGELADRLAGLLPEGALDEAVQGLRPEELTGPGGLFPSWPAGCSRRPCRRS